MKRKNLLKSFNRFYNAETVRYKYFLAVKYAFCGYPEASHFRMIKQTKKLLKRNGIIRKDAIGYLLADFKENTKLEIFHPFMTIFSISLSGICYMLSPFMQADYEKWSNLDIQQHQKLIFSIILLLLIPVTYFTGMVLLNLKMNRKSKYRIIPYLEEIYLSIE